jgi:hypothetical protein
MTNSAKALTPGRMRPAEACYRVHAVLVESGIARDAILVPAFWSNVAAKLRPLDRLEVMDDAGSWLAVLMVRAVSASEAIVAPLWSVELQSSAVLAPPKDIEFEARWRGHKNKWSVLQGDVVLREGMESREEAELYIRDHAKALAA